LAEIAQRLDVPAPFIPSVLGLIRLLGLQAADHL
jgi:hypothetical protein